MNNARVIKALGFTAMRLKAERPWRGATGSGLSLYYIVFNERDTKTLRANFRHEDYLTHRLAVIGKK